MDITSGAVFGLGFDRASKLVEFAWLKATFPLDSGPEVKIVHKFYNFGAFQILTEC